MNSRWQQATHMANITKHASAAGGTDNGRVTWWITPLLRQWTANIAWKSNIFTMQNQKQGPPNMQIKQIPNICLVIDDQFGRKCTIQHFEWNFVLFTFLKNECPLQMVLWILNPTSHLKIGHSPSPSWKRYNDGRRKSIAEVQTFGWRSWSRLCDIIHCCT